ncbi:hypothetical protein HYR99_39815 [Candidatus Poribacteria bacterium]|nr:hypothetical protein [Candidatus Poribacteria bacterium]
MMKEIPKSLLNEIHSRTLIDTNIWIVNIRFPLTYQEFFHQAKRPFISAISITELIVGTRPGEEKDLQKEIDRYVRTDRVVVPTQNDYYTLGELLLDLKKQYSQDIRQLGIAHDVLIALAAFEIGATLITENRGDFVRIKTVMAPRRTLKLGIIDRGTGNIELV